ncbi:hypothetical protein [Actinomadura rudentiformis]|uniref:Uncharacterized protein n=1 Tax=Actinomadura rudentiformis TaxID=359158 RepID=A0A6H9YQ15_9ACTN|nr:hypothetical protein [Actinomadura rudentiformis]KAB2348447.1 hypothetical protein F8566_16820 [Actinomadura rudentiformis]
MEEEPLGHKPLWITIYSLLQLFWGPVSSERCSTSSDANQRGSGAPGETLDPFSADPFSADRLGAAERWLHTV